jgi:hypothetical protein
MKKLFTLAAVVLTSVAMMAATYKTYSLSDLTKDGSTYEVTGLTSNDQKLNKGERLVEVPSADAEGTLFLSGTGENLNRFASVYKSNGTVYDADRKIAMTSGYNPTGIAFNASDLLAKDGKYYIVFGSSDDYKINAFKYTLADPTKATVKSISVNGVALADFAADKLTYNYELAFGTTDAPVVTAVAGDGATINITQAAAVDGTATVVCTSKDESASVTYTINFSVASSASSDASLKGIKVDDKALANFKADSFYYEYHVAYTSTAIPTVTAEENDENANAVVTPATEITKAVTDAGTTVIVVTAQDGTTKLTYKVAFIRDDAVKKINEVILSNSYNAYILDGQAAEPYVINGYYLAGQDAPTVTSYKVNDGTTWAQEGNTITLTGADASTATYALTLEAVAPLEFTADAITFAGNEAWVKAAYGFKDGAWKFSKTDSDYSREIAGKTHIEMFLPACDSLDLVGAVSTRDVRIYINGTEFGDKFSLPKDKKLGLKVEQANPFMLTIKSAQTSGDGGVAGIQLFKSATVGIEDTEATVKAVKFFQNGQLFIEKNGKVYTITGSEIR